MSELIRLLEASRDELVAAARSVSEASAQTRPAEGRWSVTECVEHLVIVEERSLGRLQNPEPEPAPPASPEREAMLVERASGRTEKFNAPDPAQPKGRLRICPKL